MHKCPNCKRKIFWGRIYCALCIKLEPSRERFRLSRSNRWLKNIRRPNVGKKTTDHLFVNVSDCTLCVECGRKLNGADLKHDCFFRLDSSLRVKNKLSCSLCKQYKLKGLFTIVRHGGMSIRTKVCTDCLDGSKLVIVSKRKYEKRKVA